MIDKNIFLKKYNISKADFDKTLLKWEVLVDIFNDFERYRNELEQPAIYLFNTLMKCQSVHSVRYRIKDSEHLIEKIIRKKIEDSNSNITLDNYKEDVTDLIGLRALHLYKDDWENVHDFIMDKWNCIKTPVANYRNGDADEYVEFFKSKGCLIKIHKYGYRSVHYLIETQPAKMKFYAEIQVRTIFEEAWSEIDHTIRYPYDLDNVIFFQFLLILNRLAGSADEMGSYIKFLKQELTQREKEFQSQLKDKSRLILDLESKVAKLGIKEQQLQEIRANIEKLKNPKVNSTFYNSTHMMGGLSGLAGIFANSAKILEDQKKWADSISSFNNLGAIGNFNTIEKITRPSPKVVRIKPKEE